MLSVSVDVDVDGLYDDSLSTIGESSGSDSSVMRGRASGGVRDESVDDSNRT